MIVTFDSNTWRKIVSPNIFPNDPYITQIHIIRDLILKKEIDPFLSETIFTLEAIKRIDRKDFFKSYEPSVNVIESDGPGNSIRLSIEISPNKNAHPGNNPIFDAHFKDAVNIGFSIIHFPRIAGIVNPDIEQYLDQKSSQNDFQKRLFAIGDEIEKHGAGIAHIKNIGQRYHDEWQEGISIAPNHENGNISKAFAEWADGDSIACHIAMKGDYFCTEDLAISAGNNSILSSSNISWLNQMYGLEICSNEELAIILTNNSNP